MQTSFVTILTLIGLFECYKQLYNLSQTYENKYQEAVSTLLTTLSNQRDLNSHHFQPCRACGYFLALVQDPTFCVRSDLYKLLHPDTVLEDLYVFRDYAGKDLARQLIRQDMFDAIPPFFQIQKVNQTNLYHRMPLTASVLYPYAKNYLRTHKLGQMGGCLLQKYAHIPGQDEIALKSNSSTHFLNYIKKLENQNKSQECIDDAKYYKDTIRLWIKDECNQFFQILNSSEYQEELHNVGVKYIFKTNRHLGNGIMLVEEENEKIIRGWYKNGELCGKNFSASIVQEYIRNPYLYNGYKLEFRAYFAIISTNPHLIYGYKVALIKQCALKFNLSDFTKQGHVCNTAVTKNMKEKQKNNDDELYIDWNLEELQDMLYEEGRIQSKDWLEKELRPQIYRKAINLYLSIKDYLFVDSRMSEFFGIDFILDDNLRLWILECNRNPNFLAVTEGRKDKFGTLLHSMLELNQLYIRSKMKRIKNFIENKMIPVNNRLTKNLQDEFMAIQEDYLEPEFQLPNDTNFVMVYADSQNTTRYNYTKYMNNECLI